MPRAQHYRTILANERTLLAWQGMALALLATSIAVQCIPAVSNSVTWQVIGIVLAVAAAGTAFTGLLRWRKVDRATHSMAEH